jgi:hypothetical protein
MRSIFIFFISFLTTKAILAQTVPITSTGIAAGQKALRKQNALNPETVNIDRQFDLDKLQKEADQATSHVTPEQKAQQYDLGAEILPYVATHINKMSQDCVKSIGLSGADAAAKYSECSKQAVQSFQKDPISFINNLPDRERKQLEALVKQKIEKSANHPIKYSEP